MHANGLSIGRLPPELLYIIIEELEIGDQPAAALVCKAWNSVATVIIWSSNYVPLDALWTVLFEDYPQSVQYGTLELPANSEKLFEKNWDKFLDRAKMVAAILVVSELDAALHEDLRTRLTNQGIRFLCPNVSAIHALHIHRTAETCVFVGGRRVTRLHLTVNEDRDWQEHTPSALCALPQDRYLLEHLKIDSDKDSEDKWDTLQCATLFPRLLTLHYQSKGLLTVASWRLLSIACPSLRHIQLEEASQYSTATLQQMDTLSDTLLPVTFPVLKSLDVTDCSSQTIFDISISSQIPRLIRLCTRIPDDAQDLPNLTRLARHYREHSPNLQTLEVDAASLRESYIVIPEYWALRELIIRDMWHYCYPMDQEVEYIAKGLPKLMRLVLSGTPSRWEDFVPYGMTFEGVLAIGSHCPALETLEVAVDARDFKIYYPFKYCGLVFPAMKEFTLRPLSVASDRAKGLAYFLRGMAPMVSKFRYSLYTTTGSETPQSEHEPGWCGGALPKTFQDVVEGRSSL